jgi:hypothetical protein
MASDNPDRQWKRDPPQLDQRPGGLADATKICAAFADIARPVDIALVNEVKLPNGRGERFSFRCGRRVNRLVGSRATASSVRMAWP